MATDPVTYRDHFLSIYQSVVDELVRSKLGGNALRPGLDNGLVRAAAQISALRLKGVATIPDEAPANVTQTAWTCARLAFELMQAKVLGNDMLAGKLEDELTAGGCDPRWAETIKAYLEFFGPDGTRDKIPYTRAFGGMRVLPLKPGAVVAMMADWGTGTRTAVNLLKEIAQHKPDAVIHLGDIYYSGTPFECEVNFQKIIDDVLDRKDNPIPVYTMAGNHDMYSGGEGYYGLLQTLNPPASRQPASFFCLRSTDNSWQFVAMDTGLHDYNPFNVTDVLTFLEKDEEDWLAARIAEFSGKTILLSHHQLFSAFAQIGPAAGDGKLKAYNPHLADSFDRFSKAARKPIAAWFWGHEHTLTVYAPYRCGPGGPVLDKGRCIGHGAVPVLTGDAAGSVPNRIVDPPKFLPVQLDVDDHVFMHGFVILRFGEGGSAIAEYYEEKDGTKPIFTESL